jgi:creatinine amidohydrolase
MTWPEIAKIPRETPLAIPLGLDHYDPDSVATALGAPSFVVLPPIPYGFPGADGRPLAALAVGKVLFRRVLIGVKTELRRQGFQRACFLDARGVGPWAGGRGLEFVAMPQTDAGDFSWPPSLAGRVVVISTGHTEQHGLHLPTGTDTLIAEAIAQGVARAAPDEVVCLPTWPYGVSTHTREFPGTLDIGGRVFEDFFLAVVGRLASMGAEMVLFSNGHGGNHSYLVNIVKSAGERWPGMFTAVEFLHTTGPSLAQLRESPRGGMGHGGELETSYILHLRPELVNMSQAVAETDFISTANYYMDWIEGGRLTANPPWSDDTRTGIYGDATLATAEKGRLWLKAAIDEKLGSIEEIREQHRRRSARRASSWRGGQDPPY